MDRNAHHLKHSNRFRYNTSISRDKIREDRELERAQYHANKLRRSTINGVEQLRGQNNVRQQDHHTPAVQEGLVAPGIMSLGETTAGGDEQLSAMISGTRNGTSTTVGEDTSDPHMPETEISP